MIKRLLAVFLLGCLAFAQQSGQSFSQTLSIEGLDIEAVEAPVRLAYQSLKGSYHVWLDTGEAVTQITISGLEAGTLPALRGLWVWGETRYSPLGVSQHLVFSEATQARIIIAQSLPSHLLHVANWQVKSMGNDPQTVLFSNAQRATQAMSQGESTQLDDWQVWLLAVQPSDNLSSLRLSVLAIHNTMLKR